jgi:multicomponent Na+:H+ antiporter subunit D
MAVLALGLVVLVLVYSWAYMQGQSHSANVLFLTFGAAMAGFSLTGDIFNMFVWFELMGVSAYALAGFNVEELGPLQGALAFAVTNTVGAYMILAGIALLYARTGFLNLAAIGHALAGRPADSLVIVAFALILTGLMVKAAIVPFHFWLADAHAASPAPVCVLLSGAMVELGIFFIARVYWTVFASPLQGHHHAVQTVLVALGVLTALLGAFMCFLQRHLKRLLAYSTIAHSGIMLTGVALLDPTSLSGVASLVLAHGLLKGGLFMLSGVVLFELRRIDELKLRGAGRGMPVVAGLWFASTIGLAGVPYVGAFDGHQLLDEGARSSGYPWLAAVAMVAAGVSAGAMLRAGARVFLGWGAERDELLSPEPDEQAPERPGGIRLMIAVSAVAIVLGLVASVTPGLGPASELAARRFADHAAYTRLVLHAAHGPSAGRATFTVIRADPESALYSAGALAIALAVAAFGLWHRRLPAGLRAAAAATLGPPVRALRAAHSGIIGDYLLWLCAGTVVVAGAWALSL